MTSFYDISNLEIWEFVDIVTALVFGWLVEQQIVRFDYRPSIYLSIISYNEKVVDSLYRKETVPHNACKGALTSEEKFGMREE